MFSLFSKNRMDLKETYNKIAENWQKDHSGDGWWMPGVDAFISRLPSHALVWDAGCGAGVKSKYLAGKGLHVIGTDFSEKMVELASREVPEAEFFVSDIREPKNVTGGFDGVFLQAVLLHIPKKDAQEVVGKLLQKLKPGGYIYIAVKEKRPGEPDEAIKTESDYGYPYERFFSYFDAEELKRMLLALDCEMLYEAVVPVAQTRWIQIIAKKI